MKEYYTRVMLHEGVKQFAAWEHVVDDKIVGYIGEDKSPVSDYQHGLKVTPIEVTIAGKVYGARAMIEDPWALDKSS